MPVPYVYERQAEYWTSRAIEEFFLDSGFEVLTFPLSQLSERILPADFLFVDKTHAKLFGLQYKPLYRNGEDFWPIDLQQNERLKKFPWIYYCLSDLREASQHRLALHFCRIVDPARIDADKIFASGVHRLQYYSRWAAFYENLTSCRKGHRVESLTDLLHLLEPITNLHFAWELRALVDVFVANFKEKRTVHFSPLLMGQDQ